MKHSLKNHKVCIAIPSSRISGVDIFSIHLVRGLIKQGIDAEIILTNSENRSCHYLDLPTDIPVKHLAVEENETRWYKRWNAMIKYLEKNSPCFYIPNYDWYHSCVTPKLSNKVKVIGIAHSDDKEHYEHISRLGCYFNSVVGVSKAITNHIKDIKPQVADRLHYIPYGVDIPSTLPQRNAKIGRPIRIVYAGRMLQKQKRIFDIVRILGLLRERNIPFEMSMIGEGMDKNEFIDHCKKYKVENHIKFSGAISNSKVSNRFAENDIFILTSDYEGLPLSLLEAMAQGCIPIVSNIKSGIPQLIENGVNGYKVEIGKVNKYADHIEYLYNNTVTRNQMSLETYHTVLKENYSIEKMTENYIELFEKIINDENYTRSKNKILPPPMKKQNWKSFIPTLLRNQLRSLKQTVKGKMLS